MTTPTTTSRPRARTPSVPMNTAVIALPARSPNTGDRRKRMKPAAPVKPSSESACTAKAMFRATTNRLTTPDTIAMTAPAAIAFCTNS